MRRLKTGLVVAILSFAAMPALAQLTLYEDVNFRGRSVQLAQDQRDLRSLNFNDAASSAQVSSGCRAVLYSDIDFRGANWTMNGGMAWSDFVRYGGLNDAVSSARVECGGGSSGGGWSGGGGGGAGVTLYQDEGFRGSSQSFTGNVSRLGDTRIGNDSVSSVRIAPGCRALVFSEDNFRGTSMEVASDLQNMRYMPVGNDQASSIQVRCGPGGGGGGGGANPDGGITLYHDAGFRGGRQKFTSDVSDMKNTNIGHDAAASLRLDDGCSATLYTDKDYRGRSARVFDDVADLASTSIGRDSLSSFRVDCSGEGWGGGGGGGARRAARIYRDPGYRGMVGEYSRDVPNLGSAVGSADLDPGCQVTFYERPNYQGRSATVTGDRTTLSITNAGSMRVNCGY